jgi:hypothetical protein
MIIALLIAMAPLTTKAGALERQFGGGYEGVIWGASLAELVQLRPGGEHFFAAVGGVREYGLLDERSMFGITRGQMRAHYFLDDTNSVVSVGLTFPFDHRQKLLGALVLSFGPYARTVVKGITTSYLWPRDDGIGLSLRETIDPSFGILELAISGPNSDLQKKDPCVCEKPLPVKEKSRP